jgi:hypothetical protein
MQLLFFGTKYASYCLSFVLIGFLFFFFFLGCLGM